jgi:hypothetical protein
MQPREEGIYLVKDGNGCLDIVQWNSGSFMLFGCDEPFYYFPEDVPDEYIKYPCNYVREIVREIIVEELNA